MEEINFDQEIRNLLEGAYQAALKVARKTEFTPEQLKLMIVAHHMTTLANTFLVADENSDTHRLDMKRLALGVYGCSDWIKESL